MTFALPSRVFRVTRESFATSAVEALSGVGGVYDGGRWHTRGQKIVYTSTESSGCFLERLVHGDEWIAERDRDRVMLTINIPVVSCTHYTSRELQSADPNWQQEGNATCRNLGDIWLNKRSQCLLAVPSAANPLSMNLLMNPHHPDYKEIIAANEPLMSEMLEFDERVVSLAKRFRNASGKNT